MTFSSLANVGTSGSATRCRSARVRDAFEDRMADGTNMGFRRTDALLGVVILTDENDCCTSSRSPRLWPVAVLDR